MAEPVTIDTIDNGEIPEVHVAPIGEFFGSTIDGQPVHETLTAEDLAKIADALNDSGEEVLADVDHGAARSGASKESRAAGWFSRFIVDPIKGMFAKLKLTKYGKELLENREYRWVSPTFMLDNAGKPMSMSTISLTNTPAFAGHISPIINARAQGIEDMTKEELIEIIKDTVKTMSATESSTEAVEDKVEEKTEVVDACADDKDKTATNEDPGIQDKVEDKVEEKTEVVDAVEDNKDTKKISEAEEKEVIKIETLNQMPCNATAPGTAKWQHMNRDEFIAWFNAGNR